MARVKQLQNKEDLAPEHHALFDELAALRGRVSGPSTIVLHSPGLAPSWNQISEYLHGLSPIEAKHYELAVCATAREYDCGYVWAAHVPLARNAGVSDAAIDAVRSRGALDGLPAEEASIVRYVRQLLQGNRVDSEVFEALRKAHGDRWMVDLNAWIGRYGAISGILNSFDVQPAHDADQLPAIPGPKAQRPVRAPLPQRIVSIAGREQLPEADRHLYDAVSENRGNVRGPFALLMYSPLLCKRVIDLSNYLRHDSSVTPRLRELATIATAREKDSPFVWAAHAPAARKEGVDDATITTVRDRGDLAALSPTERDIVEYARELLGPHRVSQALFDRMVAEHSIAWLVDLTALIGHYGSVTALLNAIEVSPAAGAEPLPLG